MQMISCPKVCLPHHHMILMTRNCHYRVIAPVVTSGLCVQGLLLYARITACPFMFLYIAKLSLLNLIVGIVRFSPYWGSMIL